MPRAVRPDARGLSAEQLQQVRIPFVQRATLVIDSRREELFLVDLGLSGAFAEREAPLPVGAAGTLSFLLPGNSRPVRAGCRVAWWHPPNGRLVSKRLPAGVGLEFVDLTEPDRRRLRQHLIDYLGGDPTNRRFHRPWPPAKERGSQ